MSISVEVSIVVVFIVVVVLVFVVFVLVMLFVSQVLKLEVFGVLLVAMVIFDNGSCFSISGGADGCDGGGVACRGCAMFLFVPGGGCGAVCWW